MVFPLSRFASAIGHPLDLILHIGPGALASPADYAPLNPAQLLLVEAHPAAAARLQSAFGRAAFPTRVLEKLLLPESGPASLFQFNLPAVNGIRPAGGLSTLYPNLRLLEELPLEGEAFSSFLASLPLEDERPRLLILDVPGQELGLLESLSPELLARFEWILLRGSASAWQEHSNLLSAATAFLDGRYYESVAADFESDPAWPLQLLRLNHHHAALQRELDSRAHRLESLTADTERDSLRIAELEHALSQHAASASEAAETRAALEAELNSRTHRLESLAADTERHSLRIAELEHALSLHAASASEAAETRAALEAELDSRARLLIEKATEIYQQSQRLTHLEPQLAQFQAQNDSLQTELHSARALADSQSQQFAATSEQLAHAHAQLRSLETTKAELESALASQKTLVQALTKGRAQQDQLFAELAAERDALQESLASAQLRITDCEAQLSAKDTSTSLLDTEFQKIEGQMDLIRGLVFRDHGR
jgi:hypothetical protein